MSHEFDKSRWVDPNEPDSVSYFGNPEASRTGEYIARYFEIWQQREGDRLAADITLLVLGAGRAFPELDLAKRLQITPDRVTLVDRQFSKVAKDRFAHIYPAVQMVESGMFSFLKDPPKQILIS